MIRRQYKWILWTEVLLAWLVLLALIFYTYVELVDAPYIGFDHNSSTGAITSLDVPGTRGLLRDGDMLLRVNDTGFAAWRADLSAVLFPAVSAGDVMHLEVLRDGKKVNVQWTTPGFNWPEFSRRVWNAWWMGYLFWLTGLATLLLVRPADGKRSLFAAFFFLTALWLVIGNTSRWGLAESRLLYRMALCLSVPVLLHLHWVFPRSFWRLPVWLVVGGYAVAVAVCALHLTPLMPSGLAASAYALALVASLVLLGLHFWLQPETRNQVRLLFYALLFAVVPIVILTIAVLYRPLPYVGSTFLLSLPIIPGAYFYSLYRFQLGGSELRANRLIALYLYLIALGTLLLLAAAILSGLSDFADSAVLWITLLGMAAALTTHYVFPWFQRVVDRRLLAIPLPPVKVIDTYLARITTTLNEPSLIQLLKDEVLPSMLVRQSALLRIHNDSATTIYTTGDDLSPQVLHDLMAYAQQQPVQRVVTMEALPAPEWVRLGLALRVEGKLMGLWLLGRHDPDDLYSPLDIATLQTLARQTALALANIEQAAQLQALYQASIELQEQERMKMAHFLHDAILNQAAVLYMSLDAVAVTTRVDHAYNVLKELIHQMVSNLRPPSLDFGLGAALEELASEFGQRAQAKVNLHLTLPSAEIHYPAQIENHIFRIVQQACENALRHARAKTIEISGTLASDRVDLTVADDGVGFAVDAPLDMTDLLAHKHFGLVHMMERAEHIHAHLALESAPGQGTRIHLTWLDKRSLSDE